MLKSIIRGLISVLLLAGVPIANATVIDFEAFADGTILQGVNLGGVTLTGVNGNAQIYSNDRFGALYHSPVNSISDAAGIGLNGTFDSPTSFVSLWAGDSGGDIDSWTLQIFDAGNSSLGFTSSGNFIGNPYTQLTLSASGITRFEARWTGSVAGVAWDDLGFSARVSAVPEPATLSLFALVLAGLGYNRRKQA